MEKDIRAVVSANLSRWMQETPGLDTMEKVSTRSGVSFGTVQRVKKNQVNASITALAEIARTFGRTVADLTQDTDAPPPLPETVELVRTVEELTASGKMSPVEIKAMTDMLKTRR